jgi:hypothetical protein
MGAGLGGRAAWCLRFPAADMDKKLLKSRVS